MSALTSEDLDAMHDRGEPVPCDVCGEPLQGRDFVEFRHARFTPATGLSSAKGNPDFYDCLHRECVAPWFDAMWLVVERNSKGTT